MKILIHINSNGPIGAWRVVHGSLESYYDEIATTEEKDGAEGMIRLKSSATNWDIWFDKLAERSPYFFEFAETTAPSNQALGDTLAIYQQEYNGL